MSHKHNKSILASPGCSLGNTRGAQTDTGLYTKDNLTQNQYKLETVPFARARAKLGGMI